MKIAKIKNNKSLLILIATTIVAITLLFFAFYYFNNVKNNSTNVEQQSTSNDTKEIGEIDYSAPTNDQQNPALDNPTKPSTTPAPSEPNETIPVTISALNQTNSALQVRVLINSLLPYGTCTLTLSRNNLKSIESAAETFVSANSTTCKGFDIDLTGVEKGTWKLAVTVSSDNNTGKITKDIEIK